MANWKEYTTKTTPEDADEIMIADAKANANKRTPLGGLWNWIAGKLATAVISQLETQNKSIIPALNELNSNAITEHKINSSFADIENERTGFYAISYGNTTPSSDPSAPDTSTAAHFWFVIHAQRFATRKLEIAISPFRERNTLYFRTYHDRAWYGWYALTGEKVTN